MGKMNSLKRKICVYTSSRAEYGLLRGVIQEIQAAETLQLQILASGMHLSPEFGMTIQEIRADGFEPDETIEILLSSDTPAAICKSMGLAMIGYGEAIERLRPDIVLLLGDRFETFCMAGAESYDLLKRYRQGWVEKYLGNGNNIRFESPQRLIKQIAWPDPARKLTRKRK